jgi:hypothetical protein
MTNSDVLASTESPTLTAKELTAEEKKAAQKARAIMSNLQKEDPEGIPILEVLDTQSDVLGGNVRGRGFIGYDQLGKEGKNRSFFIPDTGKDTNGVFVNLTSAYAEAITLQKYRNALQKYRNALGGAGIGSVVYEPAVRGGSPSSIVQSFNGKTPDILMTVPSVRIRMGSRTVTASPKIPNVVDGERLKNTPINQSVPLTIRYERGKNLIMPIEVTTSGRLGEVNKKIEKFSQYKNLSNSRTSYVPVLVMDESEFNGLGRKKQIEVVDAIKAVGGNIVLEKGLNAVAEGEAIKAANRLEKGMNKRDRANAQDSTQQVARTEVNEVNSDQELNNNISNTLTRSSSSTNNSKGIAEKTEIKNPSSVDNLLARLEKIKPIGNNNDLASKLITRAQNFNGELGSQETRVAKANGNNSVQPGNNNNVENRNKQQRQR